MDFLFKKGKCKDVKTKPVTEKISSFFPFFLPVQSNKTVQTESQPVIYGYSCAAAPQTAKMWLRLFSRRPLGTELRDESPPTRRRFPNFFELLVIPVFFCLFF